MKTTDDLLTRARKAFQAKLRTTNRNDGKAMAIAHCEYQILRAEVILKHLNNQTIWKE